MAENQDGQEKSEQPSARRLEKARSQGQVPSSRDLPAVLVMFGGVGLITVYAPLVWRHLQHQGQLWFERAGTFSMTPDSLHALLIETVENVLLPLLPFGLIVVAIGMAAVLLQTGLVLKEDSFKPDLSKLNPVNGIKRLFSLRGVMELAKALLKVGIVAIIVWMVIRANILGVIQLPSLSLGDALDTSWSIALQIILDTGVVLFLLAIGDFVYQRWQFMKDMRMTKQEVKDESRDVEGDPFIRSRRQSLQRERARQRMLQAVPNADVVITNPTHVAVALRYEAESMTAPTVVAKGAGAIAEKIKQIARHAGVPIIENRSLARGLFRSVKIGQEIPADVYRAAAELLAFVYRVRHEQQGA